jgi:hypothetical protein
LIYQDPRLEQKDHDIIDLIRKLRRELRHQVAINPVRLTGFLRRNTLARNLQGSNRIEGINADLAEAIAIVDEEKPETLEEEAEKTSPALEWP